MRFLPEEYVETEGAWLDFQKKTFNPNVVLSTGCSGTIAKLIPWRLYPAEDGGRCTAKKKAKPRESCQRVRDRSESERRGQHKKTYRIN